MTIERALAGIVKSGTATYIEDVFSTYLYTGNGSTQTITNGIDVAGKGGMIWAKCRSNARWNYLTDTAISTNTSNAWRNILSSDLSDGASSINDEITSITSTGFTLGGSYSRYTNYNGWTYASWTFRKQPKFFDVVTYTGTGSARTIAHNLGSAPGMIIVKRTDTASDWAVYHNSMTSASYYMKLNLTNAQSSDANVWNSTAPSSTVFSVGTSTLTNANTGTYVAYLFAHDAGGFGAAGTDSVTACGSFTTGSYNSNFSVTLGWEPQLIIYKTSSDIDNWNIVDTTRGWSSTTVKRLRPNTNEEENVFANTSYFQPTSTGFSGVAGQYIGSGLTYIYLAIRKNMKV